MFWKKKKMKNDEKFYSSVNLDNLNMCDICIGI